ncbi:2-polyprenyl-3-methyl-5-hydroxy-6-metoxy-1,4-benzoquinol methylase [Silvibacterium bohemicum]|uniref:2-polyprenyl-3-methyl-5-hydroxy-6-metoxy-1, 4-benzoquinol methylase n=1 Tax=Silvibacterium bohemicum TaxID=1577686 RepID=A0A841JLB6_9BACT|nr:methyltransferase domain-containing protein [Silvibacterium bohemicum]MBB6142136.1 2-polyprenyl-3-methyl-5-hydroxy-6-metoxy-1,4-benzoquinol methylase [Silvibacterium bohemicum]
MTTGTDIEKLKASMRKTWTSGDFGKVAPQMASEAETFVGRLGITPEMRVLDVACGTGNLAIPAARRGATVTGLDIAPNLLEQARQRAAEEKLAAVFVEGDAEQLPFPDEHFDVVMSMFGAMFAPRPELVAKELARVCKPGGKVAMANWTFTGAGAKMSAVTAKYLPPPADIPSPGLWGDQAIVRERLAAHGLQVETTLRAVLFQFPFPPKDVVQFFREYFGPVKMAFERMDAATQQSYAADLEKAWTDHNEGGPGRTALQNEYLEVIGIKG